MGKTQLINVTPSKCAPVAEDNYKKYGTCLSKEDLKILAKNFNHTNNNQVKNAASVGQTKIPTQVLKAPKKLYKELIERTKCQDDICLISKDFAQPLKDKLQNRYRPKMRSSWKKNPREWLNTFDIEFVMKQYEEKYNSFKFLGVFPVDFYIPDPSSTSNMNKVCYVSSMCKFTLAKFLEKGDKTSFGMVINLDNHKGPGTHWVSLYANFDSDDKFCMTYFDSGGSPPPKEVKLFMKAIKTEVDSLLFDEVAKKPFRVCYNTQTYQKLNTECGMFAMIFLITCLETSGDNIDKVKEHFDNVKLHDDLVWQYRKQLYIE